MNEEGEGGGIWLMYFIYLYENKTIKSIGIVLRSGEGGCGRMMEEVNQGALKLHM
jgi:hypothetical protein